MCVPVRSAVKFIFWGTLTSKITQHGCPFILITAASSDFTITLAILSFYGCTGLLGRFLHVLLSSCARDIMFSRCVVSQKSKSQNWPEG